MKPLVAVSMGDPAGVGPEVLVRAAADPRVIRAMRLQVYGDRSLIECARRAVGAGAPTAIEEIVHLGGKGFTAGRPRPGKRAGNAAFAYLEAAAAQVLKGDAAALVTAPVNKAWVARSGRSFSGHTGYLSEISGHQAVMMLAGRKLRVIPVTEHIALASVSEALTTEAIVRAAKITAKHLRRFHGVDRARLAVAALNPHAGEDGLFGDEEAAKIAPAVAALRRAGINVEGPLPADTLFAAAKDGQYDGVICMYHDQALIPLKLVEFGKSVNISMGLPIIRTSPDHGTAYGLAGTGKADEGSMREALLVAARMVRRRVIAD